MKVSSALTALLLVCVGSVSVACSGGAVSTPPPPPSASVDGADAAASVDAAPEQRDWGQAIADELFQEPEGAFDEEELFGLYEVTSSRLPTALRLRLAKGTFSIAYKNSQGDRMGMSVAATYSGETITFKNSDFLDNGAPCVVAMRITITGKSGSFPSLGGGDRSALIPVDVASGECKLGTTVMSKESFTKGIFIKKIGK